MTLAGSFTPWLRSGDRSRSSYDLLQIVDRLGFSPDGAVGWAVRLWPLLPLLLVLVVVGAWASPAHRQVRRAAVVASLVAAGYAIAVATAIAMAPEVGLFAVRSGPWVTIAGALLVLASAVRRPVSRGSAGPAAS